MNAAVRTPPARDRLLRAASDVFYREGLRAVGVDRVIERAGVTRATFYRHFPSKELLLVAYVQGLDRAVREHVGAVPGTPAESARWVRDFTRAIADQLSGEGFRGCPFINAAAEYPDADHPVRQAVSAHRDWLESSVATALERAGHPDAEEGARRWLAQRDGAMVGGYLGSPAAAAATLVAAVDDLVGAR
ncbi:TetR/AcrR family transcriptional regulator [Kineosporia sp. J2-2]|uniref:TetR/AcrR family transcriptional regulator n=1 Tax=Kineosporia corallincola TaxID=2835133 RepID=A0ABS5TKL8_9ACTN|nr:TetR/AcrR family transcriptional regulator [Kineosporia corallincola]MBT0771645.1 TetR/AcrR family transcriptional regulator [Kineosporia corallincola]